MKTTIIDLTGQRFGRLLVVAREANSARGTARWACACDCGGRTVVQSNHLRNGATVSCGCVQREAAANAQRTHGLTDTPTYIAWRNMVQRCTDKRSKCFMDYGGRGIQVCERWLSFENFFADMGERPTGLTIERNDVNGGYEPSNCRWATKMEQANNTRRNRFLTAHGRTMTAAQWSRELGTSAHTILKRIARGWSVERAVAQ